MKILFITSRFPFPPLKGDKIRSYYPIKLLSQKHQIDLLSFTEERIEPKHIQEMEKYCNRIDIVKLNKLTFMAMLVFGVFSPWPSQIFCYNSFRMKRLINTYIKDNDYDIVHIVCGRLVGYARYVHGIPKIIDWIDSLSLSTERMYKTEKSWIKKVLFFLEWKKMNRYERQNILACDFSFITSQVDNSYLNNEIKEVIPNGVDINLYRLLDIKKNVDLIFTGNMSYFPNIKAVEFFCEKVFPLIIRKRPETTFYISGINPSKHIRRYHDGKNVFVTGYVENMTEMLNRSKIFVAPLQSGAGIQNKILEAMACSLPIVSTNYGNAGIQARNGDEIIIEDNPEDFANVVLNLLSNELKGRLLGANAHDFVKKNFSWDSKTDRLDKIYIDLLNKKAIKQKVE